jgi:hypothetical protein
MPDNVSPGFSESKEMQNHTVIFQLGIKILQTTANCVVQTKHKAA